MPGYEVMTLVKRMTKPEVAAVAKRLGEELIKQGTLLRRVENFGERKLSYVIKDQQQVKHDSAQYILFYINAHRDDKAKIRDALKLDQDVMKVGIHEDDAFDKKPDFSCVDPLWRQESPFERF